MTKQDKSQKSKVNLKTDPKTDKAPKVDSTGKFAQILSKNRLDIDEIKKLQNLIV